MISTSFEGIISEAIDKYSVMSHCQGNAKLKYSGSFSVQLQMYYRREINSVLHLEKAALCMIVSACSQGGFGGNAQRGTK